MDLTASQQGMKLTSAFPYDRICFCSCPWEEQAELTTISAPLSTIFGQLFSIILITTNHYIRLTILVPASSPSTDPYESILIITHDESHEPSSLTHQQPAPSAPPAPPATSHRSQLPGLPRSHGAHAEGPGCSPPLRLQCHGHTTQPAERRQRDAGHLAELS